MVGSKRVLAEGGDLLNKQREVSFQRKDYVSWQLCMPCLVGSAAACWCLSSLARGCKCPQLHVQLNSIDSYGMKQRPSRWAIIAASYRPTCLRRYMATHSVELRPDIVSHPQQTTPNSCSKVAAKVAAKVVAEVAADVIMQDELDCLTQ